MSVSKLTWVMSPLQVLDADKLNVGGWLTALATCITNHSLYWEINNERTTAPRWVELKRKGTVSGDLATARILIFGGTTPHANALEVASTAYANALYIVCCPTANTSSSGPGTNYDVGDPYNGFLSIKALNIYGSTIPNTTAIGAAVYIIESEEAIFIILRSSNTAQIASAFAGKLWTAGGATQDDFAYWMAGSSNNAHAVPSSFSSASMIPACYPPSLNFYSAAVAIAGSFKYEIGRVFDGPCVVSQASGASALSDNGYLTTIAIFHTILLAARIRGSSGNFVYAGKLRQIRYGPSLIDRATTFDSGVQQSYFVGSSQVAIGFGYHFDQFQ